ncbi:hypothetical protein Vadar_020123 [Vaccinium darrowii]|uniref:Uncharacterized protein n=1 Tax=Vaccinium darrowii TaxID=229202 RepID=A0ACB7YF53_9ERIC|nr:hypothetical protein Vadar_020123 [Vaccinium darrowii]
MGKRARPRKTRSKLDADQECKADPTWSPKGSPVLMHCPTATSQNPRRHRKGVLTTPPGYSSIRNADGHDSTLTPLKKIPVEKTDSLSPNQSSPTTVHSPTTDNLTFKLPFQTQGFLSVPMHYPPPPLRSPKRCGKAVVGKCGNLTIPSRYPLRNANAAARHDSTLTPAKNIVADTSDGLTPTTEHIPNLDNLNSELPFQTQVSNNPAAEHLKSEEDHSQLYYKWLENGCETTENLNDLMDVEQLTSDLHQSHAQEKLHLLPAATAVPPPPHEVVIQNQLANVEATEACNIIGNGREEVLPKNLGQKAEPTRSSSLNLTEMAAMSYDNSSDDEVNSALNVALVTVNGYRVKEEFASLLRKILSKFGDIAKDSSMQSVRFRSFFLETVCRVFQQLQGMKFTEITSTELKSMLEDIKGIESVKVEVGWLRNRLEEIEEAKILQKGSSSLKGEKTRIHEAIEKAEREVEGYESEMKMLQEKISLVKEKLAAMKSESEKINGTALKTKTKVNCFYKRSLVDGLL